MKEITKLYNEYCIDFNQNFNTFDYNDILYFKNKISNNELDELKEITNEIFTYPVQSVTYDRPSFVSNLDKRQYFSIGLYYWPNPNTKDGLPYVSIDGDVNPDAISWAKGGLRKTGMICNIASLIYLLSNDSKYYELLKKHIYNFFINEETKMLPNLDYAQLIMGDPKHEKGRGIGIIDFGAHMGYALVLLKHLYDENRLEDEIYLPLRAWCLSLLDWLNTSHFALDEKNEPNNHGSMYTQLKAQLQFFTNTLNKEELLNEINIRIESQIQPDGRMDLELLRTRSIAYSTMNIKAFVDTYKIIGEDYSKNDLIKKAILFMAPVLNDEIDISDIKVMENGVLRDCIQIENTYLNNYKMYIRYIAKKFNININVSNTTDSHYKFIL